MDFYINILFTKKPVTSKNTIRLRNDNLQYAEHQKEEIVTWYDIVNRYLWINATVFTHLYTRDLERWPLTLITFLTIRNRMKNIYVKFGWNPFTKYGDIASSEIDVNGQRTIAIRNASRRLSLAVYVIKTDEQNKSVKTEVESVKFSSAGVESQTGIRIYVRCMKKIPSASTHTHTHTHTHTLLLRPP